MRPDSKPIEQYLWEINLRMEQLRSCTPMELPTGVQGIVPMNLIKENEMFFTYLVTSNHEWVYSASAEDPRFFWPLFWWTDSCRDLCTLDLCVMVWDDIWLPPYPALQLPIPPHCLPHSHILSLVVKQHNWSSSDRFLIRGGKFIFHSLFETRFLNASPRWWLLN